MKLLATKKQIRNNTHEDNLISVGYCDLQRLLKFKNAFAYSKGVYGWTCDYYELENNNETFIISTGYNPIGKQAPYQLVRDYEKKADVVISTSKDYEEMKIQLDKLINEFLSKIGA
tara:strand:+ start:132 stop:479 length:348 start_codon:yes stop_codon:yes gene_type:complete